MELLIVGVALITMLIIAFLFYVFTHHMWSVGGKYKPPIDIRLVDAFRYPYRLFFNTKKYQNHTEAERIVFDIAKLLRADKTADTYESIKAQQAACISYAKKVKQRHQQLKDTNSAKIASIELFKNKR